MGRQEDLEPAGHRLPEDAEKLARLDARAGAPEVPPGLPDRLPGRALAGACGVVGVGAQLVRSGHKNLEVDFPNMIYDAS